jgi:glycerol-3-phosphate dehydrogenase
VSGNAAETCDLLVIGGGINGTGIARDAAGRGLTVILCEQQDLASFTSSASTKLIHGGLRYLEDFHFALVRKALIEREILLASAPHLMRPLRFVVPHEPRLRPAWQMRAGLFLYDHLARRRRLAASGAIDLSRHPAGSPLKPGTPRAFIYSDGWTDDARLTVLNALDARARGATVLTRTRCERLTPHELGWRATLSGEDGPRTVLARAAVNATGPWVSRFIEGATPVQSTRHVRMVKGSHIVLPQLFTHRFAYLLQGEDRRIIFAIPYPHGLTLVGTTDVEHHGDPSTAGIDAAETAYLLSAVNRCFQRQSTPADVVWSYSGVRPLVDDDARNPAKVSRDYALELARGPAPLLSVFGGKITTYRKLAESAVDLLARELDCHAPRWTATGILPGGDLPAGSFARFLRTLARRHPWLPRPLRERYAQAYGTRVELLLQGCRCLADLGAELTPGLHEREADYLWREEWARSAEDLLWRRSKLGLATRGDTGRLDRWLAARSSRAPAQALLRAP